MSRCIHHIEALSFLPPSPSLSEESSILRHHALGSSRVCVPASVFFFSKNQATRGKASTHPPTQRSVAIADHQMQASAPPDHDQAQAQAQTQALESENRALVAKVHTLSVDQSINSSLREALEKELAEVRNISHSAIEDLRKQMVAAARDKDEAEKRAREHRAEAEELAVEMSQIIDMNNAELRGLRIQVKDLEAALQEVLGAKATAAALAEGRPEDDAEDSEAAARLDEQQQLREQVETLQAANTELQQSVAILEKENDLLRMEKSHFEVMYEKLRSQQTQGRRGAGVAKADPGT